MEQLHTKYNEDTRKWENKQSNKVLGSYKKKEDAIEEARKIAKEEQLEHIVYSLAGKVSMKFTYKN